MKNGQGFFSVRGRYSYYNTCFSHRHHTEITFNKNSLFKKVNRASFLSGDSTATVILASPKGTTLKSRLTGTITNKWCQRSLEPTERCVILFPSLSACRQTVCCLKMGSIQYIYIYIYTDDPIKVSFLFSFVCA